ncbi:nitrogen regulation protein NR(I) [Candidatus Nitromaritima sp. SCGC AAA799-C22]|nr:nitrogen regulation protein NR(I) [Candidatus Nitromaritima sp. SCGC AAA799-C22]
MNPTPKILIVDDEENIRRLFKKALEKKNYTVHTAPNAEEALRKIRNQDYFLVFCDIFMDGMSGLDLLKEVKGISAPPKVVVMTAQDTMNNTIEAMRSGAYDYISKPFDFDEIYSLVDRAETSRGITAPPGQETIREIDEFSVESIVGKSKKMQDIFKTIGKSAASDLSVLITGESGTGKEMVAGAMHYYSRRKDRPFICINCAAISRELLESELFGHEKGSFTGAVEQKKGKFEIANGGTLFLDEIGDMELQLQAKILRVLQNKDFYRVGGKEPIEADVRIIAATNQNLEELMEQKRFREDLFHRLNVIHIFMPPLRERAEDVTLLANHFLRMYGSGLSHGEVYLSPETERILNSYSWRGNIRELENVIKRAVVLASSGPILPEHLPDHLVESDPLITETDGRFENRLNRLIREHLAQNQEIQDGTIYEELIQSVEKQLFEIMLDKHFGKQVAVAKALGINRNTLKRKIDAMKIEIRKHKNSESS